MTQPDLTEWDDDLTASKEEEYAALLRAIHWAQGFGLLFVQCTPAKGEGLVKQVQRDTAEKVVRVLRLEDEIENLYEVVTAYPDIENVNVLFVIGIEKSLAPYIKPGYGSEGDYYAKDTVPKLLGKLNLQRERFKADFPICFVFLVPRYAMRYLIRRAADFFDWRSGVWEFALPQDELQQESRRLLHGANYDEYCSWTPQQRWQRVLEIDDLLTNPGRSNAELSRFYFEKGNILAADRDFKAAIEAYDAALAIKPNDYAALFRKGIALSGSYRYQEAIANYDKALLIKPQFSVALDNKGVALRKLGRYEEAIAAYDAALAIQPNNHEALNDKGWALDELSRYEDAILACNAALAIKPEFPDALNNKGWALGGLGRYEEAISVFDTALLIKPEFSAALYNKGSVLFNLGRYEEAIAVYDQALAIQSDDYEALDNKARALSHLGRYEEAIAAYDAALEIQPEDPNIYYNKACCYGLYHKIEPALENLSQAIRLAPDKYRELAKTDTDLDTMRDCPQFKALLNET